MQLAQRIGRGYAWLWPKQRPAADGALQQLLLALSARPTLLQTVLPQLVTGLLGHTLRHTDAAQSRDARGGVVLQLPVCMRLRPCASLQPVHDLRARSCSAG